MAARIWDRARSASSRYRLSCTRRYPHGDALPLYQMIAKNAGIRRARGQFVLATNIDILFSNELAEYLAARRLERGRMYRIDRHDVMSEVPVDVPVEGQLAWCGTHLIRINRREGSFPCEAGWSSGTGGARCGCARFGHCFRARMVCGGESYSAGGFPLGRRVGRIAAGRLLPGPDASWRWTSSRARQSAAGRCNWRSRSRAKRRCA